MPNREVDQFDNRQNSVRNDADLYELLQNAPNKALNILYDLHASLVYGIAFNLLTNTQEAEDLTQDIFLSLTTKCTYNPKKGSLRTFLAILTRSRALDRIRSRTRANKRLQKQASNESQTVLVDNSLELILQQERSQEVRMALEQLSDREREVLKMSYYSGLSQSEIAAKLKIPLGTVKSRSRSALLKLRQHLKALKEGKN